ncbi:MAG: hypothetical protein H7257_05060 [Taibaiella sp.]|nr:hypothetical protein [Taibaiella sp.]
MTTAQTHSLLEDRRIKILNFLLQKHQIPEYGTFNLKELIEKITTEELRELYTYHPDVEQMWEHIDLAQSLTNFLVENGLAKTDRANLRLTVNRGRDLQKQGSYLKLLEDERNIVSEARRVTELELEADRMAHRQFKINALIAFGTCIAALYYILEILNGFFGFYSFGH